ncbi:MAG: hypothetical protein KDB80_14550, partial [Planctomycetes bacterium]|nr:hypothetical protein [Planctomycetota bacterium]
MISTALELHDVYAVHWLFFHTLAKRHPSELRAWFRELRRFGGGDRLAAKASAALLRLVADGDAATSDEEIDAFDPQWQQVFRVFETGGRDWEQTGFDRNAICWRTAPAGTSRRLNGELRVLPAGTRQMNLLLGRRDDGFVSVAIVAGERGGVTVFDYRGDTDEWRCVVHVGRSIPLDEFFRWEIGAEFGWIRAEGWREGRWIRGVFGSRALGSKAERGGSPRL